MSEWKQLLWGDIATLEYGRALRGYQEVMGPVRVFGTNGPVGWTSESQSDGPGVIIGRKGAYRGVHYSEGPFWVIDTAYYLKPKCELDLKWVYYALKIQDINSMDSGSAIPSTSRADFYALSVDLPPLANQRAIAAVLGALDDKIAVNERIVGTAMSLADAQFERAVASEPVQTRVGEVAMFHNRDRVPLSSRQRSEFSGPYPYYGANGVLDAVADFRFDGDYVLVGEDGTVVSEKNSPVTHYARGKFWVNNHAHVLTGLKVSSEVLLSALKAADVRPYVTGAVQPKLSMGNLKRLPVTLPNESVRAALERHLRHLYSVGGARAAESRKLAELRDTLLPGLMSGAIRVRDAEKAVEAAT